MGTVRPSVSEPPVKKPNPSYKQLSVSEQFPSTSNQSASNDQRPSSTSHSASNQLLSKREKPSEAILNEQKPSSSSHFTSKKEISSKAVLNSDFQFDAFDSDELDWEGNGKEKEVAKPAFRYLNEFAEWSSTNEGESSEPFLSKCFIVTFLGKFRSDADSGFHIDVKITDGISTFNVRISDSVCSGFLRFSAGDYLTWKKDKERHREKLSAASKRLVEFNQMMMLVSCLFRLEKFPKTNSSSSSSSSSSVDHLDAVVVELREFGLEDLLRLHKDTGRAKRK